ncbi:MAG: O-antigen ligase family protein [Kiritimatiellia bacterium]
MFTSANIWIPLAGNDLPTHILLRLIMVVAMVGAAIISRPPARGWDAPRISALCWIAIIMTTMAVRGTGIRQLGSSLWGGKDYIYLLGMLFFLIAIPPSVRLSRKQWIAVPIIMALLPIAPLLADLLFINTGGKLYFLFYLFKPGSGVAETTTMLLDNETGWRIQASSRLDILMVLLLALPWAGRQLHGKIVCFCVFLSALAVSSLGGFRGGLLSILGVTIIYAWLRAPQRRVTILAAMVSGFLGLVSVAYLLGPHLPSPVQRVLTIVPFSRVDPIVRIDADRSSSWRVEMWRDILQTEVRPHLVVGRGFSFDPNKLTPRFGRDIDQWASLQNFIISGNFHNGPLSALVLFGIPGLLTLLVLMFSSIAKHLRIHKMEWHDPVLQHIHFIFLCYFIYSTLAFLLIYGDLAPWMSNYLSILCLMEILGHTRREEVDALPVHEVPGPLVPEPVRQRAIRYT